MQHLDDQRGTGNPEEVSSIPSELSTLVSEYPELRSACVAPPPCTKRTPVPLQTASAAELRAFVTGFAEEMRAYLDAIAPLPKILEEIQEDELQETGSSTRAGRVLRALQLGNTLTWSIRLGRHFLLPLLVERNDSVAVKRVSELLPRMETLFTQLFDPPAHARANLPVPLQEELIGTAGGVIDRVAEHLERDAPVLQAEHILGALNASVHLQDERLGLHVERVGYGSYALSREYLCRLILHAPEDWFRLIISLHPRAGALPLAALAERFERHRKAFQGTVSEIDASIRRDWDTLRSEEVTRIEADLAEAQERRSHYIRFLRSAPLHTQAEAGRRRTVHAPVETESLTPAATGHSRMELWIKQKYERREDDREKVEHDPKVHVDARDARRRTLDAELADLRSFLVALRSDPQAIEGILARVPTGAGAHPHTQLLLDTCPALLYFDERVRELEAITTNAELDPARFDRTLRARRLRRAVEELLGSTTSDNDTLLRKIWDDARTVLQPILAEIEVGAEFHDIGKIGQGKDVLSNTQLLTDEQRQSMQRHPLDASFLLEPIAPRTLRDLPKYHHHNYDGSSGYPVTKYPCTVARRAINFGARVLNIIDSTEAAREGRGYRHHHVDYDQRMLDEHVLAELLFCSRSPSVHARSHEGSVVRVPWYMPDELRNDVAPKILRHAKALQFDPELADLAGMLFQREPPPPADVVTLRVEEIQRDIRNVHRLAKIFETLWRTQVVRNPDVGFHALLATITCNRFLQVLPEKHPLWKVIDAEAARLSLTRDEWLSIPSLSLLISEIGKITSDLSEDRRWLTQEHPGYTDVRRAHIEGTDALLQCFGSAPWVDALRETILFHHAKPGGRGFIPTMDLTDEDGGVPAWRPVLERTRIFASGDPAPIPLASSLHEIIGALMHRASNEGLPPDLAFTRLQLQNLLWQLRGEPAPKFPPELLATVVQTLEGDPEVIDALRRAPRMFERPSHHGHTLEDHSRQTGELATATGATILHPQWLTHVADDGAITPRVHAQFVERLVNLGRLLDQSSELASTVTLSGLLHDVGKVSRENVERNRIMNLRASALGEPQHVARGHERASAQFLRRVLTTPDPIRRDALTTESPLVPPRKGRSVNAEAIDLFLGTIQEVRAEKWSADRTRFLTTLVAYHLIPLEELVWVQERSAQLLDELRSDPFSDAFASDLPPLTWAHTVIELLATGMAHIPEDGIHGLVPPLVVARTNALLARFDQRINRIAALLASCEQSFLEAQSFRAELDAAAVTQFEKNGGALFLDSIQLIWLSDMASKRHDIWRRPDIADYVLVSKLLVDRARERVVEASSLRSTESAAR